MRLLLLGMIALLCLLQYRLWYADGSVVHRERLAAQLAEQQAENEALIARNSVLEAQVADLKSGSEAVEALARSELGLVKPGETFYHVVDPYKAPNENELAENELNDSVVSESADISTSVLPFEPTSPNTVPDASTDTIPGTGPRSGPDTRADSGPNGSAP